MTYLGIGSISGQFLVDTQDNTLYRFGSLEGDVSGVIDDVLVTKIRNIPVETGVPQANEIMKYVGGEWTYAAEGGANHNLLSATHNDADTVTVTRGDLIVATGTAPTLWTALSLGGVGQVLYSDGNDAVYTQLGQNTPFTQGTAAAPGVTFSSNLNAGLSMQTNNVLVASVSGTAVLSISAVDGLLRTTLNSAQIVKVRATAGASDSMVNDDYVLLVTAAGGTITLPTSPATNQIVLIKDRDGNASSSTDITIDTPGAETIDGNAQIKINRAYGSFTLLFNGTNWNVI